MCGRVSALAAALLLLLPLLAGEAQPAPPAKKVDWSDLKTLKAYWDWVAVKMSRPPSLDKTSFDASQDEKGLAAVAMLESAAPNLDDMKKGTLIAANIIGQMLAQGAPIYKVGIVHKRGEEIGIVMLPVENLKKFGAETIKGDKADKAAVKRMTDLILTHADWSEVEKLVKKSAAAPAEK